MAVYLSHASLRNWADPKTYHDGKSIYQSGAVRSLRTEGNRIFATVGNCEAPVYTRFQIKEDGTVVSDCPCFQNQHFNTVCAHVTAAGFAVADLTEDPRKERLKRIGARIARDQQTGTPTQPVRTPEGTHGATPACVCLRLPENWKEQILSGNVHIDIHISVEGKKHAPERISTQRSLSFSARDTHLLYVLEDFANSASCPPFLELDPNELCQLFEEAAGHALRIKGSNIPIRLSEELAICAFRLSIDQQKGNLLLDLQTEPPGNIALLTQRSAWILSENTLYPLDSIPPLDLVRANSQTMRIPRRDLFSFLHQRKPDLESRFIVQNDIPRGLFRFQQGHPDFEVHIRGENAERAVVSLKARYGEQIYNTTQPPEPHEKIPDANLPFTYQERHLDEEQQARSVFLAHFDAQENSTGEIELSGGSQVIAMIAEIVPAFERLGWKVRFGEAVALLTEDALWVHPCLTITSSAKEADSYRMETTYQDANGAPVSTEMIEIALQRNQAIIACAGKVYLLNTPGLNTLQAALAECIEYREGTACVSIIHAGFIQALLHAFADVHLHAPAEWNAHANNQQSKINLPPAPVQDSLFWQLRPYQRHGVDWLCFLDRNSYGGILADEMGLGKTVQALAWIQARRDEARLTGHPLPSIVICPTSLIYNWAREVERFTPDLTFLVVAGNKRKLLLNRVLDCDLVITSYALLRRDIIHYDRMVFSAVVLDEAQHIKNRSTQNATAAKRMRGLRRLVLTGTPIENSVNDLWSIMDFLMPGYLGSHTSFKIRFEQPISTGTANGERALRRLQMKLEPFMLRRLKTEVAADLPDKVNRIATCPMLPAQRRLYRRLQASYQENLTELVENQGFEKTRFSVFSALLRLRQCCCHPALLRHMKGAAEAESGKMDLFFELLDEAMDGGHRVLVFSQFVQMLHILRNAMIKRSIPFAYLDGRTRDRMAQVDEFNNNPDIPVFLVSLKAGGSGLNLTGANVVIHYDPWWNPAVEDQATDRTHRIGQLKTVYSIKLVTENSIEQKVIELQQRKRAVINATIGPGGSIEQMFDWEDVQELLRDLD